MQRKGAQMRMGSKGPEYFDLLSVALVSEGRALGELPFVPQFGDAHRPRPSLFGVAFDPGQSGAKKSD